MFVINVSEYGTGSYSFYRHLILFLGILYKAKRFASIRTTTKAKVWALERRTFQKIVMNTVNQEREQNIKFLKSVSVLNDLSMDVLHKIVDLLKRVSTG